MLKTICLFIILFFASCKTTTIFVVRHAERDATATMTSDVPLSIQGQARAQALKELLEKDHIRHIFSTNYIRTKSTAQPLADAINIPITIYDPRDTAFVTQVRNLGPGNVLIVGHSNTVDNLVNQLMGQAVVPGDLPDTQYGDLFVIRKKGKKYSYEKKHFGL